MTYDFYIGIDPGEKGGIAVLTNKGEVDFLRKIPEDYLGIAMCLDDYAAITSFMSDGFPNHTAGCIEIVHSMPGQGVASSFKFGKSAGSLEMALRLACDSGGVITVSPQKWQKALGIKPKGKAEKKSEFKQRLRATAQKMFPRLGGITLQTCDALLIAVYCKRLHEGTL